MPWIYLFLFELIIVCYHFNKYLRFDEYLFSLQYINNGKKNISLLSPQILGKDYLRTLGKGDIIGLIPFKPDISFKFMTYSFIDINGIS